MVNYKTLAAPGIGRLTLSGVYRTIEEDTAMDLEGISKAQSLLEAQQFLWGPNSIEVANTQIKLAQLYSMNQQYDKAEACLLRAVEIKTKLYGNASPEVLRLRECHAARSFEQPSRPATAQLEKPHRCTAKKSQCSKREATAAAKVVPVAANADANSVVRPAVSSAPNPADAPIATAVVNPIEAMFLGNTTAQREPQPQGTSVSFLIIESSRERFELRKASLWLGRDTVNDICLPNDHSAEKSHAMITWDGNDFWLTNQAKESPTMVNSKPVTDKVKLRCGDTLTVGTTKIRIG